MANNRYRWYIVGSALPFLKIVELVQGRVFSPGSKDGFDFWSLQKSRFTGRFISERKMSVERVDPFGEIRKFEDVFFGFIEFEFIFLRKGTYLLKVINPPASIKKFLWALGECCGDGVYFDGVRFLLESVMSDFFDGSKRAALSVAHIRVKDVPLSSTSLARIEVSSSKDACSDVKSWLKNKNYVLDRLKATGFHKGREVTLHMSASGLVVCNSECSDSLTTYIASKN